MLPPHSLRIFSCMLSSSYQEKLWRLYSPTHCNTLQHTATHCNSTLYSETIMQVIQPKPPVPQYQGTIKPNVATTSFEDIFMYVQHILLRISIYKWKIHSRSHNLMVASNPNVATTSLEDIFMYVEHILCRTHIHIWRIYSRSHDLRSCRKYEGYTVCCSVSQCVAVIYSWAHSMQDIYIYILQIPWFHDSMIGYPMPIP